MVFAAGLCFRGNYHASPVCRRSRCHDGCDVHADPLDVPLQGNFTTNVEGKDNGIKVVEDLAWANGNAVQRRWTAKYDGKDYPVEGDPRMDTISLKKPNPNTIDYVVKKSGKQFASGKWVVSKDGKTSTNTGSAKVDKGPIYTYDMFLEKQ